VLHNPGPLMQVLRRWWGAATSIVPPRTTAAADTVSVDSTMGSDAMAVVGGCFTVCAPPTTAAATALGVVGLGSGASSPD
jgi:hypothetical protein